ncbi:hypothetical protein D9M71_821950 [compost metagenome]
MRWKHAAMRFCRLPASTNSAPLVHAKMWRKAAATGEEIHYEWAMLYRVENGQIIYGSDMLDRDAQELWE